MEVFHVGYLIKSLIKEVKKRLHTLHREIRYQGVPKEDLFVWVFHLLGL